ncbi:MAG: amidohydrolase family protein [Bacillota bacterium]
MSENKRLYLDEFCPRSELVVEEHIVEKPAFPVIDMHCHLGLALLGEEFLATYDMGEVVEKLQQMSIIKIVVLEWAGDWDKIMAKIRPYEDFIIPYGYVDFSLFEDKGFEKYVVKAMTRMKENGVRGIKVWKNLGLGLKDSNGKYVRLDDPRLDVVWKSAGEFGLPIVIHIADLRAFFKTADRFNEQYEVLKQVPGWSFCKPEFYTYEQLMEMQENIIGGNPDTTFVVAHVGSSSEDLSYVCRSLDRFPNMHVDIAARISELGRQPYTARKFFNCYQDRILFGSDLFPDSDIRKFYSVYFRFLETWDEYFDYDYGSLPSLGRWKIYGLGLEPDVLEKVYRKNAERILKL